MLAMNRIAVFIDNSNVFKTIQTIKRVDGSWIQMYDPLALSASLAGARELVKVNFYCVPPPAWLLNEGEGSKRRHAVTSRYYSKISQLPNVEVKYGYLQGDKYDPHEKNVDTQISSDMVAGADLGEFETAILVSSDGDYLSAVQNLKKLGKRIEILFFRGFQSDALIQMCDLRRRARRSHFTLLDLR